MGKKNVNVDMEVSIYLFTNPSERVLSYLKQMTIVYTGKLSKYFFNLNDDICICLAYIPPQDSIYFKPHFISLYELLEEIIRKYSTLGKFL